MVQRGLIAEIQLTHPDLVLTKTIEQFPDAVIDLEYQSIVDAETYHLFFEVRTTDFSAFDEAVLNDSTVNDVTTIIECDEFRVYRMQLTSLEQLVLPYAAELGMRIIGAKGNDGGWLATLEVPDRQLLQAFREHCEARGVKCQVKRLYHPENTASVGVYGLTVAQRELLYTAFENGYFNEPKEVTLREIAAEHDISASAASGRIRRGIRAILEHTIMVDR